MDQLSCPFCGSNKVKIQFNESYNQMKASGRCNRCHTRGPLVSKRIDGFSISVEEHQIIREYLNKEALRLWNNRL